MKITGSFVLLALLGLTSCSGRSTYSVDFSALQFPEIKQEKNLKKDSALQVELERFSRGFSDDLKSLTNKRRYKIGEEIILTISNQGQSTEYFYPSDEQMKKQRSRKSTYPLYFVSKDPGIQGRVFFNDSRLVYLVLQGANSLEASEHEIDGFDDVLETGEKMVFKIKMPKRPGKYLVSTVRYFHDKPDPFYERNGHLRSNIFEVVN